MPESVEELRELKEQLIKTVDELLSLRNRLAEYDSEFISKFDELELDINRLSYLQGDEKEPLKKKLLFDIDQFKLRIAGVVEGLDAFLTRHEAEFGGVAGILAESKLICPADLGYTFKTLESVYREHLDIFAGMKEIYEKYIRTLQEKKTVVKGK